MSARTCNGCGTPLPEHVQFCVNCGIRVEGATGPGSSGVSMSIGQPPVTAPVETVPAVATTQPVPAVAAAGTTVPWYRRELTPQQFKRAGIVIAVLALLAGAFVYLRADGTTEEIEEVGDLVAEGPIGPQGGELEFEKGGAVKVPSRALNRTETISVRRTPTNRVVRFPNGDRVPAGALPMYSFGPFNITFRRAITIVLPVSIDATGADIYLFSGGRLIFVAQRPNQGGTVTVRVIAFRSGRIIIAQG